jgi:glycosyltransferase involved in cell wall biosynthesis
MLNGKKVIVVLPAYNAAKTLEPTIDEVPRDVVDDIILVDDQSKDDTVEVSKRLGIKTVVHSKNRGYGGNQKTCYQTALEHGADIVVMLHPDYQYSPKLLAAMASMIAYGEYDCCLGSRILGGTALRGGMPIYKYLFNRFLTLIQNILMTQKMSEYHTGYRAFSSEILKTLPLDRNSEDFLFDNQMIAQIMFFGFRVGEISCPTRYEADSSSISFSRSVKYGVGVLWVSMQYFLQKRLGWDFSLFAPKNQAVT